MVEEKQIPNQLECVLYLNKVPKTQTSFKFNKRKPTRMTEVDKGTASTYNQNACAGECVYLWTCVASLWGSRALHGGPLAAGSPWPQR